MLKMKLINLESEFSMLLIKNGRVVDPKSGFDQVVDVLVDGKKLLKLLIRLKKLALKSLMRQGLL